MNMNKLSRAGDNIHLSEEAKQRIIDGCNANMPDESGYTDYVMTVERYKPRRVAKFASIAAASLLVAGGAAFTLRSLSENVDTDKSPISASANVSTSHTPIDTTPKSLNETEVGQFLSKNFTGNGCDLLSEDQRKKIRSLFDDLVFTEVESFQPTEDYICMMYQDGVSTTSVTVHDDCVTYNYSYGLLGPNTKKRFKVSKSIEEELRKIYDTRFLFMLDNPFYLPDGTGIDKEGMDEIRGFLNSLTYTQIPEADADFSEDDCIDLDCCGSYYESDTNSYRLSIHNNTFRCQYIHGGYDEYQPISVTNSGGAVYITADCENAQEKIAEILSKHTTKNNAIRDRFISDIKDTDRFKIEWENHQHGDGVLAIPTFSEKQLRMFIDIVDDLELTLDTEFTPGKTFDFSYVEHNDCNSRYLFYISKDHIQLENRWFKTNIPDLYTKIEPILDMFE